MPEKFNEEFRVVSLAGNPAVQGKTLYRKNHQKGGAALKTPAYEI